MGVNYLRFGNISKAQTLFEDIIPKYKKYLDKEHINVARFGKYTYPYHYNNPCPIPAYLIPP